MFLYELAIELDQRSSDVARAASALGLGEVAPATMLAPAQVAALRAHFGGAAPASGATPWGPPAASLPPPPPPPAPAAPPPVPPAASAPPPPAASWPSPTPAPTPAAAPPPPASPLHHAPEQGVPAPGAGAWPPPPPPPGMAPPASLQPGSAPGGGRGGLRPGQIAAIGVVVVLVLGLFGWMVVNTGPSEEQKDRLEASKQAALTEEDTDDGVLGGGLSADRIAGDAGPTAPDGGGSTDTVPVSSAPPTTASDPYVPVDREAFCGAAASVVAFELRFSAPLVEQDRAALIAVLDAETATWETAVDRLRAGAPEDNHNDIDEYRSGYRALFRAVRETATLEEAFGTFGQGRMSETVLAGRRITDQIEYTCG